MRSRTNLSAISGAIGPPGPGGGFRGRPPAKSGDSVEGMAGDYRIRSEAPLDARRLLPASRGRSVAAALMLVVCFASATRAQSPVVSGLVVDDRTEQPLRQVLVIVENQLAYGETDADGRFRLIV